MNDIWMLLLLEQHGVKAVQVEVEITKHDTATGVRANVTNYDSMPLNQSAMRVGEEMYRILRKEGDLRGAVWVDYTLNPSPSSYNIIGRSAELVLALAFATGVRFQHPYPSLAATGVVLTGGGIGAIDGLPSKLQAALDVLPPGGKILYPQDNAQDVSVELHQAATLKEIELIPVSHLHEALTRIGIRLERIHLDPFRGLEAYRYADAPAFFGRGRESKTVIDRLIKQAQAGRGVLLILGASGSGKSSLAQAGIIPELERSLAPHHRLRWSLLRPSDLKPCREEPIALWSACTEACLKPHGLGCCANPIESPCDIETFLLWMQHGLNKLQSSTTGSPIQYLWIIDQLEELFTLGFSSAMQEAFSTVLTRLSQAGQWIILCLRNDFFNQFQSVEPLRAGVGDEIYTLPRPDFLACNEMIQGPASLAECEYERDATGESLATRLHQDLGADTAALPLLGFALRILYEERDKQHNLLTYACYNKMGGIKGAIGQRAEALFSELSDTAQEALPRLIRSLSTVGEREEVLVTARAASVTDFTAGSAVRELVDAFIEARLLISENGRVRVTHEALLHYWPLAEEQIKADQNWLPVRQRLETDAHYWALVAPEQKPDFLIPVGLRLVQAVELLTAWGDDLDAQTRNYIEASLQVKQEQQALAHKVQQWLQEQLTQDLLIVPENSREPERFKHLLPIIQTNLQRILPALIAYSQPTVTEETVITQSQNVRSKRMLVIVGKGTPHLETGEPEIFLPEFKEQIKETGHFVHVWSFNPDKDAINKIKEYLAGGDEVFLYMPHPPGIASMRMHIVAVQHSIQGDLGCPVEWLQFCSPRLQNRSWVGHTWFLIDRIDIITPPVDLYKEFKPVFDNKYKKYGRNFFAFLTNDNS